MAWNDVAYPAGWVTLTTAKHDALFLDTDALTFALSATTATSYEVRDYWGSIVQTGSVSGSSLTLSALPRGWYKLYLRRAASDAFYGTLIGTTMFTIIATDPRLASPPARGTASSTTLDGEISSVGYDHIARGIAVLGPQREKISDAANPTTASVSISETLDDHTYITAWYESHPDSARPRPAILSFPNGGASTSAQLSGVTATVAACYPTIQYFEGPYNEPQLDDPVAIAAQMNAFRDAVKAGNAGAKVVGPQPVSLNDEYIPWLDSFIDAGGMTGVDAMSFHAYNMVNGDLLLGRKVMDNLMVLLTKHGLQGIEMWQTEQGAMGCVYGVFNPRRQARWNMIQRFLLDQYGVPKERDHLWYDTSHGFWDVPAFWRLGDHTLMPTIGMYRAYSAELFGKQWAERLDFGPVENDLYIGSRFVSPSDGSAVLALMSGGRTDGSIRLQTSTSSPLTVLDCFGNASSIAPDAQHVATIPLTVEPTYVRVPSGVTATVIPVAYGPNLAILETAVAALGTVDPRVVTNGEYESFYFRPIGDWRGAPTEFQDDHDLPATVTIALLAGGQVVGRRIDTVIVHCPTPWQAQGSFLDFDIEYQDTGGSWHVLQTITEPAQTFASPTNRSQAGCTVDCFYSGRCQFVAEFDPVTATHVRLTVRDATYGGEANQLASDAGGQAGYHRIRLREVGIYCRDTQTRRIAVAA